MLSKFKYRSDEKELLDKSNILCGLLYKNLRELDIFNRITGAYAISLQGIKKLITDHHKVYHVVDLGCGSGGTLRAIANWARLHNYIVKLTGIDMNTDAIDYLKDHCANYPEISGIAIDYNDYLEKNEFIDIIHCSLFCHHLEDPELVLLFNYFRQNAKTGFIINDLQRNRIAYYGVWLLIRLLNGSLLAKNDGPLSVLRGFRTNELTSLLSRTGIRNYSIQKEFLYRFLIIGKTEKDETHTIDHNHTHD